MPSAAMLADRTALVTGAGSGIGAAIAEELARAGAYVLVQGCPNRSGKRSVNRLQRTGADPTTALPQASRTEPGPTRPVQARRMSRIPSNRAWRARARTRR